MFCNYRHCSLRCHWFVCVVAHDPLVITSSLALSRSLPPEVGPHVHLQALPAASPVPSHIPMRYFPLSTFESVPQRRVATRRRGSILSLLTFGIRIGALFVRIVAIAIRRSFHYPGYLPQVDSHQSRRRTYTALSPPGRQQGTSLGDVRLTGWHTILHVDSPEPI